MVAAGKARKTRAAAAAGNPERPHRPTAFASLDVLTAPAHAALPTPSRAGRPPQEAGHVPRDGRPATRPKEPVPAGTPVAAAAAEEAVANFYFCGLPFVHMFLHALWDF